MRRSVLIHLIIFCSFLFLTACNRDPNVRKQKYFDSGDKYFADGKYREAEIQYRNALQIDSRFAQAHYQLGQTYLRLADSYRAFQELSRTVELDPPTIVPTPTWPICSPPRAIPTERRRPTISSRPKLISTFSATKFLTFPKRTKPGPTIMPRSTISPMR